MNKKYWFWICIVFSVISIAVAYSMDNIAGENPFLTIIYLPAIAISLLIYGFDDLKFGSYIIFTLYGFLIGSVIGFIFDIIYKKLKQKSDVKQPDFYKKSFKIKKIYIIIITTVLIFLGFLIYMRQSCTGLWEYQAVRFDDDTKCLSSKCVSMKYKYVGF